jgi:hypothetical protein
MLVVGKLVMASKYLFHPFFYHYTNNYLVRPAYRYLHIREPTLASITTVPPRQHDNARLNMSQKRRLGHRRSTAFRERELFEQQGDDDDEVTRATRGDDDN